MRKRTKRAAKRPKRSKATPKESQLAFPEVDVGEKGQPTGLHNVAAAGQALAEQLVEAAARRVFEAFTWKREATERSWVSTRSGRMNVRREYLVDAADLRDLVIEAAAAGFVLAVDRFAPDIIQNDKVREKFQSGPQKSAEVRLKAKLARRAEIEAHIAAAEARGERISVAQACDQLGIRRSTGYDAMNHGE